MSFESDISRFQLKLKKASPKTVRKVVFQALSMITSRTPVKTGRAKANWFVQGGSPSTETTDDTSVDVIGQLAKINGGENDIYISNNLKYIMALERGHSTQAPAGMVAISLAALKLYIESGKLKLGE